MKQAQINALRSLGVVLKRWGNSYRIPVRSRNGRTTYISDINKQSNLNSIVSHYNISPEQLNEAINPNTDKYAKTILNAFRSSISKNDKNALDVINRTSGRFTTSLSRFNRIRPNIVSPADKKLLVHFKDSHGRILRTYHLNQRVVKISNLFVDENNKYSSGADEDLEVLPTSDVELEWIDNPARSRSERKNFFRYLTKADYKLEQYQVYPNQHSLDSEVEEFKRMNYPCFLFSLMNAGLESNIVQQISQTMFNSGATVDFIRKTAKTFDLYISVKQYCVRKDERADSNITYYGDKSDKLYQLGSVGEHLFAIQPTQITKHALDNPDLVHKHGRTDFIIWNGKVSFTNKRIKFLDSYEVISYLYHHRQRLLEPITQRNMPLLLNNEYQEVRSLNEEDISENNFKRMGRVEGRELKDGNAPFRKFDSETKSFVDIEEFNIVYFDFETLIIDNIHVPYCISYCIRDVISNKFSETKNIYGFGCEKEFLESLPKKSKNLLWAHNAGFDSRFLFKIMAFNSKDTNMIDCGTKLKQAHGFYNGREIVIKDTQSFLACKLSKLPEMFKGAIEDISLEKECFPHDLINKDNFQSHWSVEYLSSFKDKDTLIANATKIGAITDKGFDCQMYATHYCNRDVDVLKTCFEAFRDLVYKEFNLDVYRFLSISSLSYAYQFNEGCFDDCYEMNSVLLGFSREGVVGGRCMTRDNEKHHIKHKVADFDAVSLYPSAMNEIKGYIKGKPKLFKESIPSNADYYIARVRIDSIGKNLHFPLQSFYEDGSRNFTNEIEGREIILGKQALEDLERFQKATFTVIEGLYWNEGFNDKITKTIRKMFDSRLKYKKQGNPLQNVFKLMMNSSYGKLLMKPIVKKKVFVSGGQDKINKYTRKNIHKMICRIPINDNIALFEEHKCLTEHFSPVHLGIQILDQSKHIMNRVMCLAEDIDAKIWYQDTDSMMIDYDDVSRLAEAFNQTYNRELIGKDMGQFHIDFELQGAKGNIFSKESIFLGKKSYLCLLACDGNDVEGKHIRMKGIPSQLLEKDTHETYLKLYNGEPKDFDLTELCSINIDSKSQVVSKRMKFIRTVSF